MHRQHNGGGIKRREKQQRVIEKRNISASATRHGVKSKYRSSINEKRKHQ